MVVFVELLKGVRKDIVIKRYENALCKLGYDTGCITYLDCLEEDGFRTLVLSVDAPVTRIKSVLDVGSKALRGFIAGVLPNFRMVVEFDITKFSKESEIELYNLAKSHNSGKTTDFKNSVCKDFMFVKRVHSTKGCVCFSVIISDISEELYATKDKVIDRLLKIKGVKRVITA